MLLSKRSVCVAGILLSYKTMLSYFCLFFFLGAAKLVVAVAVFLLTFYVISQVFEIKMDASLGNLFGKFHPPPFHVPATTAPIGSTRPF